MSWTTPKTWSTSGELLTGSDLNTYVRDNFRSIRNLNDYGCHMYLAADQSITNNTLTALVWGTSPWNIGNLWSSGSNPSRITFPITAYFQYGGVVCFDQSTTGARKVCAVFNGANTFDLAQTDAVSTGTFNTHLSFYSQHRPTSGDYLEISALQTRGSNLNILSGNTQSRVYCNMIGSSSP